MAHRPIWKLNLGVLTFETIFNADIAKNTLREKVSFNKDHKKSQHVAGFFYGEMSSETILMLPQQDDQLIRYKPSEPHHLNENRIS